MENSIHGNTVRPLLHSLDLPQTNLEKNTHIHYSFEVSDYWIPLSTSRIAEITFQFLDSNSEPISFIPNYTPIIITLLVRRANLVFLL